MFEDDCIFVILAGGTGTRFWPLSTPDRPKQFVTLFDDRSMLRLTLERIRGLVPPERILVLTGARFVPLVREDLPDIPSGNVIGEPMSRDTSGAVALALAVARRRHGNPVMAVVTADHLIQPVEAFHEVVRSAINGVRESGAVYTFGIDPTCPATMYGYLELGERLPTGDGPAHHALRGFREKPDLATATGFLATRSHLWNSGMFVWRTDVMWDHLGRCLPTHRDAFADLGKLDGTAHWEEGLRTAFSRIGRVSLDYGVMEKIQGVRVVRADFEWCDVGGWLAMEKYLPEGSAGNRIRGRVEAVDARENLVFCEDPGETVALLGVSGLVVVRSGDRTLVAAKGELERLKGLVESMNQRRRGSGGEGP